MKYQKIIIILILLIFTTGILLCPVSASHTFKANGYKYKMSNKEIKKLKKHAKEYGTAHKNIKISKVKYIDSIEKLKVGKTYKMYGAKQKILGIVKIYKGSIYGGGGYKYKVRETVRMQCGIDYYEHHYWFWEMMD